MSYSPRGECLDITTAKICSVNCRPWCPQLEFRDAYGQEKFQLTLEDFKLALSKTPQRVNIVFAGFSEPFMNAKTLEMIEYAKAEGFKVGLYSTLVGLKAEDVKRLKILDYFCLHEPDNKGVAHITLTDTYCRTLATAFQTLNIDERSRMDWDFNGQDRAGNAPITEVYQAEKKRRVYGPFYCRRLTHPQPIMLPNLDLQLCSQDWQLQHRLGSLRENTYDQIIDGELFRAIRRSRETFTGHGELCRGCSNAWNLPKAAAIELGVTYALPLMQKVRKKSQI